MALPESPLVQPPVINSTAEHVTLWAKRLASGSSSAARYDFYDPSRDVYREFQDKWDRANAAAAEAAAELDPDSAPPRRLPRHMLRGEAAAAAAAPETAATAGRRAPPGADWPPGYESILEAFLRSELLPKEQKEQQALSDDEARRLVEAARRGRLPASREVIRMRFNHLLDLESRFPGFSARDTLVSEPRLLLRSVTKLFHSMLVFQDQWPAAPVGPLMPRIGAAILADPTGTAATLRSLSRALSGDLGLRLDPATLSPESLSFLRCSPYEMEARVGAVATIFGAEGGAALLRTDMSVLGLEPERLNEAVLALRRVFAAEGHSRVRAHHVGTPEGAAAAAADRAYVTALAVAWPGVLALPERFGGEQGVAKLVAEVRAAGGRRYRQGGGRRAVLLADILARPEMLRAAAEAPEELWGVVAAAVKSLEEVELGGTGARAAAELGAGAEEGDGEEEEGKEAKAGGGSG